MNNNNFKTILLTGAGFSEPLGLKSLETLPSALAPLTHIDPVVNLVRECYSVVSGDIGRDASLEELLGHLKKCLDSAKLIEQDPIFNRELGLNHLHTSQVSSKWSAATAYCFRMMLDNYGPQAIESTSNRCLDFLIKALKELTKANGETLHLFTTNYDCLPHVMAIKSKGINFYSRINNKSGQFEANWFPMFNEKRKRSTLKIYVNRLHGCVGWFTDERSPYGVHEVYGSGSNLVIKDKRKLLKMAIKLVSEDKLGKTPAFCLAFEDFKKALNNCNNLIIWGHSFKDKELLRNLLEIFHYRKSNPFNVFFIDPYLNEKDVMNNIQLTLADIPALKLGKFNPRRLDWMEQDGFPKLFQLLKKIVL